MKKYLYCIICSIALISLSSSCGNSYRSECADLYKLECQYKELKNDSNNRHRAIEANKIKADFERLYVKLSPAGRESYQQYKKTRMHQIQRQLRLREEADKILNE